MTSTNQINSTLERTTFKILEQAMRDYPAKIAIAYSGGKDSIVLLHMLTRCIHENFYPDFPPIIFLDIIPPEDAELYASPKDESIILREFVKTSLNDDSLAAYPVYWVRCKTIKEGLDRCSGKIEAILMGIRSIDSNGLQFDTKSCRAVTSEDWPPMMRIAPLLHWSYIDIWSYIDRYKLAYPSIYDQGCTLTDSTGSSSSNPELRQEDSNFKHAKWLSPALDE